MADVGVVRSRNCSNGGSGSSTRTTSEGADWIVRVEEQLLNRKSEILLRKRQCMFFSVPKPLVDTFECFYIPDLVSIGPHHFANPNLRRMESHKIEAICRMESRILKICPQRTLKSIVEGEIMAKQKWIRDCYEDEISYSPIELAWIVTADACFIYEFILSYCRNVQDMNVEEQWIPAAKYDSIFDACGRNPMWHRIMFDLILFENQIPLSILELIVEIGIGSQMALQQKFHNKWLHKLISTMRFSVFGWYVTPPIWKGDNHHLLGVFYYAAVGDPKLYIGNAYEDSPLESSSIDATSSIDANDDSTDDDNDEGFPKLPSVTVLKQEGVKFDCVYFKKWFPKLPSATMLKQKGVKFHRVSLREGWAPIQCVGFDEKTSTLRLPKVHVDYFCIALMRNFIALEATNAMYDPYPISAFALLLNELIDNGEDCRLLSEAGIITNELGSDEEVAKSFNSITQGMDWRRRTCKSIYKTRQGLRKYLGKRHKILLSEFYSTYLSRPWQVAGLIAATLLLLMTVLQVVCLFETCNPKPS